MANDTPIEFGPGIHGIDEITYLYVREPGGHRIEINSGGWENYHAGLGADDLERAPGRHDAVEEPGDAGVDDGVLAGRRRHARADADDAAVRRAMTILVVGGGIGGLSATIALRRAGFDVDVVEKNPAWDVYGVGIIQPGNALRALNELGLAEACVAQGHPINGDARLARRRQRAAGRQRLAGARAGAAAGQRHHAPAAAQDPPGRGGRSSPAPTCAPGGDRVDVSFDDARALATTS